MSDAWIRNKEGNLIPQPAAIEYWINNFDEQIDLYKELAAKETDEEKKLVYEGTVKELQKIKEEEKQTIEISFIPLISFEFENIKRERFQGKKFSFDGTLVDDLDAHICAKKCFKPVKTYEEWRDIKNPREKFLIANHIAMNSSPTLTKEEKEKSEELKKKIKKATALVLSGK